MHERKQTLIGTLHPPSGWSPKSKNPQQAQIDNKESQKSSRSSFTELECRYAYPVSLWQECHTLVSFNYCLQSIINPSYRTYDFKAGFGWRNRQSSTFHLQYRRKLGFNSSNVVLEAVQVIFCLTLVEQRIKSQTNCRICNFFWAMGMLSTFANYV